jgi:TRAP-type C4-dicarboxylate transport system permease small subunit
MRGGSQDFRRMTRLHRLVFLVARLMAVVGGVVLTAIILITCLSILGRAVNTALHSDLVMSLMPGLARWLLDLGIGAIRGAYEMTEAGMAFCIFAFLPYCQITAGHASVDVFTNGLPRRANKALSVIIAVVFAVALVVIAVQLNEGMARKLKSGQTSLLLEYPIWWSYAASLFGAVLAAATAVYVAVIHLFEALTGRAVLHNALEART